MNDDHNRVSDRPQDPTAGTRPPPRRNQVLAAAISIGIALTCLAALPAGPSVGAESPPKDHCASSVNWSAWWISGGPYIFPAAAQEYDFEVSVTVKRECSPGGGASPIPESRPLTAPLTSPCDGSHTGTPRVVSAQVVDDAKVEVEVAATCRVTSVHQISDAQPDPSPCQIWTEWKLEDEDDYQPPQHGQGTAYTVLLTRYCEFVSPPPQQLQQISGNINPPCSPYTQPVNHHPIVLPPRLTVSFDVDCRIVQDIPI